MLDIDDFKRVNDVHGHGVGDELLCALADTVRACVRPDDVVCRLGGEEFGVIMRACDGADASASPSGSSSASRSWTFPGVGGLTVSIGLSLGPEHAMNPRELAACAEAAMMTAKVHGKNRVVLYDEAASERPDAPVHERDVRSIAHMKMLQSLSGKLNRLNDVREIGDEIAAELRSLIDYHNCRVFVVDGEELNPVAFRGEFVVETVALPLELLRTKIGTGITGRCAERGESLLDPRRGELRVRVAHPGDAGDRGVAPRRADALRRARRRRDRRLEARSEPVRRGRRAPARGACGPRGRRGREREPLRVGASRGGERDAAARVRARARAASSLDDILERVVELDRRADRVAPHLDLDRGRGGLARRRASSTATPTRSAGRIEARRFHVADARGLGDAAGAVRARPGRRATRIEPAARPSASYAIAPFGVGTADRLHRRRASGGRLRRA